MLGQLASLHYDDTCIDRCVVATSLGITPAFDDICTLQRAVARCLYGESRNMESLWTIRSLMHSIALALSTSGMFASFGLADCENIISKFTEYHAINSDAYKNMATVKDACTRFRATAAYKAIPIGGSASDCDRTTFTQEEAVHYVEQARTIQAPYAYAAYNSCMMARTGGGFFTWYEPIENSAGVHCKVRAQGPFQMLPKQD
jgi:hypothetical protein